jgi:hypothetical protein
VFKGAPSKERLALLQKRGIVHWSPAVTRATIVATVFAALYSSFESWRGALQPTGVMNPVVWFRVHGEPVLRLFVGLAVGVVVIGFVVSLLQTRGAIGSRVLAQRKRLDRLGRNPAGVIVGLCMAAAMSIALFSFAAPRFLAGLQGAAGEQAIYGTLGLLCKLVVVACVVLAILAWMITRFLFLFAHRERTGGDRD